MTQPSPDPVINSVQGGATSVRSVVLGQFAEVAGEQGKTFSALADGLELADSGFDSLCFAILVARLEDTLGVDPFCAADAVVFPRTLGDLIGLYEAAAR